MFTSNCSQCKQDFQTDYKSDNTCVPCVDDLLRKIFSDQPDEIKAANIKHGFLIDSFYPPHA